MKKTLENLKKLIYRKGAGFGMNHRQYCLQNQKLLFSFLHEKSDTLKYIENIQINL